MSNKNRAFKKLETLLKKVILKSVEENITTEYKLYQNDKIFISFWSVSTYSDPKNSLQTVLKVGNGYINKNGFDKDTKDLIADFEREILGKKQKYYTFFFQIQEVLYQNSYYNSYQGDDTLEISIDIKSIRVHNSFNRVWELVSSKSELTNLDVDDVSPGYSKDDEGNIKLDDNTDLDYATSMKDILDSVNPKKSMWDTPDGTIYTAENTIDALSHVDGTTVTEGAFEIADKYSKENTAGYPINYYFSDKKELELFKYLLDMDDSKLDDYAKDNEFIKKIVDRKRGITKTPPTYPKRSVFKRIIDWAKGLFI